MKLYPPILCPPERRNAWGRYHEKFGEDFPASLSHGKFGDDWEAEVKDIDRRIKENDPVSEEEKGE